MDRTAVVISHRYVRMFAQNGMKSLVNTFSIFTVNYVWLGRIFLRSVIFFSSILLMLGVPQESALATIYYIKIQHTYYRPD